MSQAVSEIVRLGPPPRELERVETAASLLDEAAPEETLRWAFDWFQESVTLATGFGAEGVALIDMAARINPRVDVFFLDTAFLFPETYDLRRRLEDRYGIEIRVFKTDITPEQQELRFGAKLWSTNPDLSGSLLPAEKTRAAQGRVARTPRLDNRHSPGPDPRAFERSGHRVGLSMAACEDQPARSLEQASSVGVHRQK